MTRIASWNVNGIRACAKKGFVDWVKSEDFDAILLQEVRAEENQIPEEILGLSEYFKEWFPASSKKGYSGVAILSKEEPQKVHRGMGSKEFDVEGRVISVEFEELILVSAYFPNSQTKGKRIDYKLAFCDCLLKWLKKLRKTGKIVVLAGDYNIAHEEIDLARPDSNHESPGFLPGEREWMSKFIAEGWVDTFRNLYPEEEVYSWWSARTRARDRNIGWRIDYQSIHEDDVDVVLDAGIQTQVLGSDHCPVTLDLEV